MIDTADLKRRVDIIAWIGRDTTLRKAASTRGSEYSGPCPFCGGQDRLRVQPKLGLWWCRQCNPNEHWQDVIAYTVKRYSVDFAEACRILGSESQAPSVAPKMAPAPPPEDPEPTAEWRTQAAGLVDRCEADLWTDAGVKARTWLNARGIKDDTMRLWQLGYNGQDQVINGLGLPRGIVIPWVTGGELWQIKVRRPAGDPKYLAVKGGHPLLYGADTLAGHSIGVLTEGEFDAMLLHQEVAHKLNIGVATLGSASKGLPSRAIIYLLPLVRILVAYDMDAEGEKGAERLASLSARMHQIRLPMEGVKDITDFWQKGGRLRDWIEFNLAKMGDAWSDVEADVLLDAAIEKIGAAFEGLPNNETRGHFIGDIAIMADAIHRAAQTHDMAIYRRAVADYERVGLRLCNTWRASLERVAAQAQ